MTDMTPTADSQNKATQFTQPDLNTNGSLVEYGLVKLHFAAAGIGLLIPRLVKLFRALKWTPVRCHENIPPVFLVCL